MKIYIRCFIASLLAFLLTCLLIAGVAQTGFGQVAAPATIAEPDTSKKEVRILYSDLLENQTDSLGRPVIKLSGNVRLQQDSILLFCDTAYKLDNQVVAFGEVIIQQNDSLRVFSDSLVYQGNSKTADLFGDVVLENQDNQLFTNYLQYEVTPKIARYTNGAIIKQGNTQLISKKGTYRLNTNQFFFKDSILVVDSTFSLRADTLLYNTTTKIVTFAGPTLIEQDSAKIYCEEGFFDTQNDVAEFSKNAQYQKNTQQATSRIIHYIGPQNQIKLKGNARFRDQDKLATADQITYHSQTEDILLQGNAFFQDARQEISSPYSISYNAEQKSFTTTGRSALQDGTQLLLADSLFFDDNTGLGTAIGQIIWQDTVEQIFIEAHKADYQKAGDFLKASEGRVLLKTVLENDTLFMTSDTLLSYRSVDADSSRLMSAYHDVRIFKEGLQAVADSLSYITADSLFKLYGQPVLWSDTTQLSGDSIFIFLKNGKIGKVQLFQNAFVITTPDLQFFNQIKGKKITADFEHGDLKRVRVNGNSEAIYYAQDKKNAYLGATKTICSRMELFFDNQDFQQSNFYQQPTSEIIPMKTVALSPPQLEGFNWYFPQRPESVKDLKSDNYVLQRMTSPSSFESIPLEGINQSTPPMDTTIRQ